jgi:hypothetical protein
MDLAMPSARDLDLLPDGSVVEVARADAPTLSYQWTPRPTSPPFVRFWVLRRSWRPDQLIAATSVQLSRMLFDQVLAHGDLAYPLVTLPAHPGVPA